VDKIDFVASQNAARFIDSCAVPAQSALAEGFEEILHAGEKPARLGRIVLRGELFELLQQFALAAGQVLRRLDSGLDVEVADIGLAQHRHALALETELAAVLGASVTFTLVWLPSSVVTSKEPPSAAVVIEIGTLQ